MTKIPSIEKTDDYIYRATRSKGAPIEDPNDPDLLFQDTMSGLRTAYLGSRGRERRM